VKVCEIFVSIQGESSYAGLPSVFVRMSGCNLRCLYCDTTYAYDEGREMSEDEIFDEVSRHGVRLVEITGGEPLLQKEVFPLITRFLDDGFTLLLETNGSISTKDVDRRAIIIIDIKTPKSGMFGNMDLENLGYLKRNDELKFVISDRDDYEWVKRFIDTNRLFDKCKILLSPAHCLLSPESLSRWMILDRLPARLNLQLHKYIYGDEARGV